jgi:hypothetical protein
VAGGANATCSTRPATGFPRAASARDGWATIPQVALAWLLARSPAVLPIPATTGIRHLRENLDAQDLELTPAELDTINGLDPEDTPASWGYRLVAAPSTAPGRRREAGLVAPPADYSAWSRSSSASATEPSSTAAGATAAPRSRYAECSSSGLDFSSAAVPE